MNIFRFNFWSQFMRVSTHEATIEEMRRAMIKRDNQHAAAIDEMRRQCAEALAQQAREKLAPMVEVMAKLTVLNVADLDGGKVSHISCIISRDAFPPFFERPAIFRIIMEDLLQGAFRLLESHQAAAAQASGSGEEWKGGAQ
jgi:hypothetical protein